VQEKKNITQKEKNTLKIKASSNDGDKAKGDPKADEFMVRQVGREKKKKEDTGEKKENEKSHGGLQHSVGKNLKKKNQRSKNYLTVSTPPGEI